ncbi:MAG: ABC transporter permease subunit [Deltaproteobacteria bacterium]|nr:ABC transporter permease subunit [Deltaproteobacteria bacterium]
MRSSHEKKQKNSEPLLDKRRFLAAWARTLLTKSFSIVVTYALLAIFCFQMLSALPDSFEVRAADPSANASILAAQKLRGLDKPGWTRLLNWFYGMPSSSEALYNNLPVLIDKEPLHEVKLGSLLKAKPASDITVLRWLAMFSEENAQQGEELQKEVVLFSGDSKSQLAFIRRRAWQEFPATFLKVEEEIRKESFSSLRLFPLANISLHDDRLSIVDDNLLGFLLVDHVLLGPSVVAFSTKGKSSFSEYLLQYRVTTGEMPLSRQLGCQAVSLVEDPQHSHSKKQHLFIPKKSLDLDDKGVLHIGVSEKGKAAPFLVWLSCDESEPQVVIVEDQIHVNPHRGPGLWHAISGQDSAGFGYSQSGEPVASLLFGASATCGDDVVQGAEFCDDGNLLEGDLCSSTCIPSEAHVNFIDTYLPLRRWLLSSSRIALTLWFMVPSLLLALFGSVLLAASDAFTPRRKWALLVENITAFLSAMPSLVWALLLIFIFAVQLKWFPAQGIRSVSSSSSTLTLLSDRLYHLVLPCLCLAQLAMARWFRILRPAWRDAMGAPHCIAARARGASDWRVVWIHAGRSVILVVFTLLALALPQWLGGALLIEILFALPGTGRLLFDSVLGGDLHSAMVVVLLLAMVASLSNVAIEGLLQYLDPRTTTS